MRHHGGDRADGGGEGLWGMSPVQRADRARERRQARSAFGLSLLVHGLALAGAFQLSGTPARPPLPLPLDVVWIDPAPTAAGEAKPAQAPAEPSPAPRPAARLSHSKAQARHQPSPLPIPRLPIPAPLAVTSPAVAPAGATSSPAAAESAHEAPREGAPARPAAPQEPPRFNADYLRNPPPAYPASSRRRGEEGRVLLRVQVMADGHPAQVLVHASCGFEHLDNAALDAVRHWQFVPARQGGDAVAAWVIVPVHFSLKESG